MSLLAIQQATVPMGRISRGIARLQSTINTALSIPRSRHVPSTINTALSIPRSRHVPSTLIILHSFLQGESSPFLFLFFARDDRAGDTTDPAFHFRFFALVYSFTMAEVGKSRPSIHTTDALHLLPTHRCLCTDCSRSAKTTKQTF